MSISLLKRFAILGGVFLAQAWAGLARADLFIGSGSDGLGNTLQAQVTFSIRGSQLDIELKNTATFLTLDPKDILTAVFFDITGNPSLNGPTAVVAPGTVLFRTATQSTLIAPTSLMLGSTPGGWDYEYRATGAGGISQHYGFGTAGLGYFAGGTSSGGNGGPGNYGIAQDVTYTSFSGYLKKDKKSTDPTPLVNSLVEFTLSNLPTGFQLSDISHVRFQYGTSTSEPTFPGTRVTQVTIQSVPEASTWVMAALGAVGFLGYGLRNRCKKWNRPIRRGARLTEQTP